MTWNSPLPGGAGKPPSTDISSDNLNALSGGDLGQDTDIYRKESLTNGNHELMKRKASGKGNVNGCGLVNGNGAAHARGLVNGNGLINGNGLTGSFTLKERLAGRKGGAGRVAARLLVALMLVLVPLMFINLRFPYNEGNGIYVDGDLCDWKDVPGCEDALSDQMRSPNVNIVDYRLFLDDCPRSWNSKLAFYLEVEGYLFGNPHVPRNCDQTSYVVHIFVDSDVNCRTGYEVCGLGADYVMVFEGQNGFVHTAALKKFDEHHNQLDWEGFRKVGTVPWAKTDRVLETQIYLDSLSSRRMNVLFHIMDSAGNEDFSDAVLGNEKGRLIITQETIASDVLPIGGRYAGMLKMILEVHGADIELESLNFTLLGTAEASDIDGIRISLDDGSGQLDENDVIIAEGRFDADKVKLAFGNGLRIGEGDTTILFAAISISPHAQDGRAIGLSIASRCEVDIIKGAVTLRSSTRLTYIGAVPDSIRIDGSFVDWKRVPASTDDDAPTSNQNIDLDEYRLMGASDALFAYLRVKGTMMGGAMVPAVPTYHHYTDIPVKDGGKKVGEKNENKIPPISEEPIPSELLGQDSIYIFIDSDHNASTGYSPPWLPVGAEHLVKISGKNGACIEKACYTFIENPLKVHSSGNSEDFGASHDGLPHEENWIRKNNVDIKAIAHSDELEVRLTGMFQGVNDVISVFFVAANWNHREIDPADGVLQERLVFDKGKRAENPYVSDAVHPNLANNSDGDSLNYQNLDEVADGDGVYEPSGDSNDPSVDWIEVSFPGASIPHSAAINNITYYYGYKTTGGWALTNDALSNITWRVNATEHDAGNYTLSSPAGSDEDAVLIQTANLPNPGDLNSGNFTVRFRGVDFGPPSPDNLFLDYCYFIINYSIPDIVINEVLFDPICGPFDADWGYRKKITINSSLVAEDLWDFPVLINITDTDIQAKARADGCDILFTMSDGETKLDHEIESYNSSTGSLFSWMRIPLLSSSTDTEIYMYYGNSNAGDQSNKNGVWDANHKGVWHLAEERAGTGNASVYRDSTTNDNHGDDNVSAAGKNGRINGGQEFSGNGDHIRVPHAESLNLTGTMTISFWIHPTQDTTMWNRVVEKGMWGYQTAYYFGCGNGTNDLTFYLSNNEVFDTPDNVLVVNVWQYAAVTYNSSGNATLFLNGVPIYSASYTGGIAGNSDVMYISYADSTYDFCGYIDEVRISDVARSAGWIATVYNNTNSSDQFHLIGSEEIVTVPNWVPPNGSRNWLYRKKVTIDSNQVAGDQIDFPVLIDIKDEDLKNRALPDGRDILFTGSDMQTVLDYEIEHYDSTQGKLVAWVKIATLSSTVDTEIYMYYGNPNASDQSNADAVWSNGYGAVWHLKEDPTDSPPQFGDSTSNENNGTAFGSMTSEDQVPGKIDGGIRFDGTDDRINIPQNLSLDSPSNITISGWFKLDAEHNSSTSSKLVVEKYLDSDHNLAIILAGADYDEGSGNQSQGSLVFKFNTLNMGDAYTYKWTSQKSWFANTWYQYVCILNVTDNTKNTIYINGVEDVGGQRESGISANLSYSSDWNIGGGNVETMNIPSGIVYFDGVLDETRIAYAIRSSDWVATEHNCQNSTHAFYSVGPEQIPLYQWVELYSNESVPINLSGWVLSDNDGNTFDLSGADFIPSDSYLVCHIDRLGTNSTANVFGPIINTSAKPSEMLEDADDLVLFDNEGYIVDYIAWGADPETDGSDAVLAGLWDDGDFINTSMLAEGQTLGRDMGSTDTDQPGDWENATGYADPFGIHRSDTNGSTPGLQNVDGIPEFSEVMLPIMFLLAVIFTGKRKLIKAKVREVANHDVDDGNRNEQKKRRVVHNE